MPRLSSMSDVFQESLPGLSERWVQRQIVRTEDRIHIWAIYGVAAKEVKMSRMPVIHMAKCNDCESCLDLCPSVFRRNEQTGLIELVELSQYPEDEIQEVINCCPSNCITWEEVD